MALISFWWLLVAFILGGYAGAILVGVLSMTARTDEEVTPGPVTRRARGEPLPLRRRRHGTMATAHG